MKKWMHIFMGLFIISGVMISSLSADPIKGEKILIRATHDDCSMLAPRIALQHSLAEWKTIFDSGKMEEEISKLCGRKEAIKPFRPKYANYVFEYMEHYASDSGAIPA